MTSPWAQTYSIIKKYGGWAENIFAMNRQGVLFTDTMVYEAAGYLLVQQELFSNFTLYAGLRLDHHEIYGTEPIPSAGFTWSPLSKKTVKDLVSKGFRSPTIRELFMW